MECDGFSSHASHGLWLLLHDYLKSNGYRWFSYRRHDDELGHEHVLACAVGQLHVLELLQVCAVEQRYVLELRLF